MGLDGRVEGPKIMKSSLNGYDIANTARMTRSRHSGAIMIVEGEIDIRVYQHFVKQGQCILIPAHGKDNAVDALAILEGTKFKGLIVIVDADFWRLEQIQLPSQNLLMTDTHDLETMILFSPALDKILSEFGSAPRILGLGKPLRELLLDRCLPIGYLRWLSSPTKKNLGLRFKKLSFEKFVNEKTLTVDLDKLINEVKQNSGGPKLDQKATKEEVRALLRNKIYDPWQVCCGRDLIQMLAIGLRKVFGNHRGVRITTDVLDGILRLAYEYSLFHLSILYKSIMKWEQANSPFKVLH